MILHTESTYWACERGGLDLDSRGLALARYGFVEGLLTVTTGVSRNFQFAKGGVHERKGYFRLGSGLNIY